MIVDILFWTVIFAVFYAGFKWLQKRKRDREGD